MASRGSVLAARLEDRVTHAVTATLVRRGWQPTASIYVCYGAPGWLQVLGRAVLVRPDRAAELMARATTGRPPVAGELTSRRGWRAFVTAPLDGAVVRIRVGGRTVDVTADRQGHVDARIEVELTPGWHEVAATVANGPRARGRAFVVDPDARTGLVSDIDDTVLVTLLPRPLVAIRNTFITQEHARRPVPGMADFYRDWLECRPNAPVFYLSTGAWNTFGLLTRFLRAHRYPDGPLLLTEWGPTTTGWFRSGPAHKRSQLERLARDFPGIRWLLVGDDGQKDPMLYTEFAQRWPDRVSAIAIRQLSPGEQLLAHGSPVPGRGADYQDGLAPTCPVIGGPDGNALAAQLAVG